MERKLMCARCGVDLEMKPMKFVYFDHQLQKDIPCCPKCGQYYISRELAEGKMREAEMALEDK